VLGVSIQYFLSKIGFNIKLFRGLWNH
jgi:hypothetical protein